MEWDTYHALGRRSCRLWSNNKTKSSFTLLLVLKALCRLSGDHSKLAEVRLTVQWRLSVGLSHCVTEANTSKSRNARWVYEGAFLILLFASPVPRPLSDTCLFRFVSREISLLRTAWDCQRTDLVKVMLRCCLPVIWLWTQTLSCSTVDAFTNEPTDVGAVTCSCNIC